MLLWVVAQSTVWRVLRAACVSLGPKPAWHGTQLLITGPGTEKGLFEKITSQCSQTQPLEEVQICQYVTSASTRRTGQEHLVDWHLVVCRRVLLAEAGCLRANRAVLQAVAGASALCSSQPSW